MTPYRFVSTMAEKAAADDTPFIFRVDPIALKDYVGKAVSIETNGNSVHTGFVYTVDPVSGSYVLTDAPVGGKVKSVEVVLGSAVSKVTLTGEHVPPEAMGITWNSVSANQATHLTEDELNVRRVKVIAWLQQHSIPVQERDKILTIEDALQILPPFDEHSCVSRNEIILGKIQQFLRAMPKNDY